MIQDLLRTFTYDKDTGIIRRNNRPVGCIDKRTNYMYVGYGYSLILYHRLAWMLFHKKDIPYGFVIDHIDNDVKNNTIANLRLSSVSENAHNAKKPRDNTSGIKGVSWHKASNKWRASIQANGKQMHIGTFINKDDAINAIVKARNFLHGEYARHD